VVVVVVVMVVVVRSHIQCSWISWAVRVNESMSARAPFIYLCSIQFSSSRRCADAARKELLSQLEAAKSLVVSERARSDSLFQQLQVPIITHTHTHTRHTHSSHTRLFHHLTACQALQSKNVDLAACDARAIAAERRAAGERLLVASVAARLCESKILFVFCEIRTTN
jgi:hypothetical protein